MYVAYHSTLNDIRSVVLTYHQRMVGFYHCMALCGYSIRQVALMVRQERGL